MTKAETLYGVHRAIERLEWIERHVSARPNDHDTLERLATEFGDLEAWLEKMLTAFSPPPESH